MIRSDFDCQSDAVFESQTTLKFTQCVSGLGQTCVDVITVGRSLFAFFHLAYL